jgi:histidinol-phosphate aminotransferase
MRNSGLLFLTALFNCVNCVPVRSLQVCAKVNDVGVQAAPLTPDFAVPVPELLAAVTPATKIIFLCSPGNPTAVSVPLDTVRAVHAGFDGIVVVDEAYIDFAESPSACELVHELDRVVVLQTLSKAFGMAGIRMGMAYANRDIIQLMNNVKVRVCVLAYSKCTFVQSSSERCACIEL